MNCASQSILFLNKHKNPNSVSLSVINFLLLAKFYAELITSQSDCRKGQMQIATRIAGEKFVFLSKFAILSMASSLLKIPFLSVRYLKGVKTKILVSIVIGGILGTLVDVNGGITPVAPVVAIATPPAPIASSPGAPAPPMGLTISAASPATLAAIPPDSPGGYYTNGTTCGCYINVNSPYWATNQSYDGLVYRHVNITNSFSVNLPKTGTNQ